MIKKKKIEDENVDSRKFMYIFTKNKVSIFWPFGGSPDKSLKSLRTEVADAFTWPKNVKKQAEKYYIIIEFWPIKKQEQLNFILTKE